MVRFIHPRVLAAQKAAMYHFQLSGKVTSKRFQRNSPYALYNIFACFPEGEPDREPRLPNYSNSILPLSGLLIYQKLSFAEMLPAVLSKSKPLKLDLRLSL
jgi:hypothetical protein